MIDHVWTVLCTQSITDRESNNLTLLNVIEQINVLGPVPGPIPIQLELVTLWVRSEPDRPTRGRGRVRVVAPGGTQLAENEYEIDLTQFERIRNQGRIQGVPFSGPGRYLFVVSLQQEDEQDWQDVARVPLQIVVQTPPVARNAQQAPVAN
jgi:hypothetical protein